MPPPFTGARWIPGDWISVSGSWIWSPGFYNILNYAAQVSAFVAKAPDGTVLAVEKPTPSRWTVKTGGRPSFTATYTLAAPRELRVSRAVSGRAKNLLRRAARSLASGYGVCGRH